MRSLVARVAVFAAVLGAVGCGGSDGSTSTTAGSCGGGGGGGGSCSFVAPAPAKYAGGDTSTVQAFAEDQARQSLEQIVGRWVRRDALMYRGTVQAKDNQGLGQPPPPPGQAGFTDQTIPSQPAFATLEGASSILSSGTTYDDAMVLHLHGTTTHQYVPLSQVAAQPGVTIAGIILGDTSTGGDDATCTGCAPAFAPLPANLAIASLDATRVVQVTNGSGDKNDVTLHVGVTASLDAIDPCALAWDDLMRASEAVPAPAFVVEGDDMVWHASGTAPIPGSSRGMCGGTAYTIDLYVNRTNFADYGVRNFAPGAVGVDCPP